MRLMRSGTIASRVCAVCLGFALLGLSSGAAQAQVVTEFSAGISAGSFPAGITAGPDGNLWFAEQGSGGSGPGGGIGRITPLGVVTEFKAGVTAGFTAGAQPWAITAGPDGNLWFTDINLSRVGRITTAGVVTEFTVGIPPFSQLSGITAGPDGNLWFTNSNYVRIGRITTAGVVAEFSTGITGGGLRGITAGPDGNLWFAEFFGAKIGRITTAGVITEFPICCTTLTPGAYGIPTDALAISVNVAVTNILGSGNLSLYRGDGVRTGTFSISFLAGQTRANNEILQLALDGSGSFKVQNTAPGNVDFILDVNGFFRGAWETKPRSRGDWSRAGRHPPRSI